MVLGAALASLGLARSRWSDKQWTHAGENIVVTGLPSTKTAKGPQVHGWYPSQEQDVGSWTNVIMSSEGGSKHYGVMFSSKELTGNAMPGPKDRVAVFLHQPDNAADFERTSGALGPVTLVPVKPSGPTRPPTDKKKSSLSKDAAVSDLEARLHALEQKHQQVAKPSKAAPKALAPEAAKETEAEEESMPLAAEREDAEEQEEGAQRQSKEQATLAAEREDEEDLDADGQPRSHEAETDAEDAVDTDQETEEAALLQLGEAGPSATGFSMPWINFGAVSSFIVPAHAAGTSLERGRSLERDAFANFPSLEVEVKGKASPVKFRRFAELEKFLPVAAPALFFYPWGLAYGTSLFAATLDAADKVATGAVKAATALWAPFFPYAKANAESLASAAKSATALVTKPAAALAGVGMDGKGGDALKAWYWGSLFWLHCGAYYWLFWQLGAFWWMYWWALGAPKMQEYNAKVADYWKGVAAGYSEAVAGVANATTTAATAAAAYPLYPFWPWAKPTKAGTQAAHLVENHKEAALVAPDLAKTPPPAAAAATAFPQWPKWNAGWPKPSYNRTASTAFLQPQRAALSPIWAKWSAGLKNTTAPQVATRATAIFESSKAAHA